MYGRIQHLHFIGIGGIGMSGIAEVLLTMGYRITGSDLSENRQIRRLKKLGAEVMLGHDARHVEGADVVIFSSAVSLENPERRGARERRIPQVPRAEMLAELMRLKYGIAVTGTHGKTTTTSLIATLLGAAGLDPTVVNGGVVKTFDSNARLGQGDFLVAEADESDGSFVALSPTIAVVTNMDPEHLDYYGQFDKVREAFREFVRKTPFYGLTVLCRDHPEVMALSHYLTDRRVITFGLKRGADYRAVGIEQKGVHSRFEVHALDVGTQKYHLLGEICIALPGAHYVMDALAAIAVARELEISWAVIARALEEFGGVRRRFDLLLETPERIVIDDYAHHPVEISGTLAAVRRGFGVKRRVVAVFQPHRYTRVRDLFDEFCQSFREVNTVLVTKIYSAGEKKLSGILQDGGEAALVSGIRKRSMTEAYRFDADDEHWREELESHLEPEDIVIFLGAGSITERAQMFARQRSSQKPSAGTR